MSRVAIACLSPALVYSHWSDQFSVAGANAARRGLFRREASIEGV
jgi:hypothetical protein